MAPRARNMPGADVGPTYSKSLILKGPKMGRVSKNGCFEKFWRTLPKKFHFFLKTSAGRPLDVRKKSQMCENITAAASSGILSQFPVGSKGSGRSPK